MSTTKPKTTRSKSRTTKKTNSKPTSALLNILSNPVWNQVYEEYIFESDTPILIISNNKKDYNHLIEEGYNVDLLSERQITNEDFDLEVDHEYNVVIWNYPSNKYLTNNTLLDDVLYEISEISQSWGRIFLSTTKAIDRPWNMLTGTKRTITYLL